MAPAGKKKGPTWTHVGPGDRWKFVGPKRSSPKTKTNKASNKQHERTGRKVTRQAVILPAHDDDRLTAAFRVLNDRRVRSSRDIRRARETVRELLGETFLSSEDELDSDSEPARRGKVTRQAIIRPITDDGRLTAAFEVLNNRRGTLKSAHDIQRARETVRELLGETFLSSEEELDSDPEPAKNREVEAKAETKWRMLDTNTEANMDETMDNGTDGNGHSGTYQEE